MSEEDIDPLHRMAQQELLDLRLAHYQHRKTAVSPEPFTTIRDGKQAQELDAEARPVILT